MLHTSFEKVLGTTSTLANETGLNTMIDQLNQQPTYSNDSEGVIRIIIGQSHSLEPT